MKALGAPIREPIIYGGQQTSDLKAGAGTSPGIGRIVLSVWKVVDERQWQHHRWVELELDIKGQGTGNGACESIKDTY